MKLESGAKKSSDGNGVLQPYPIKNYDGLSMIREWTKSHNIECTIYLTLSPINKMFGFTTVIYSLLSQTIVSEPNFLVGLYTTHSGRTEKIMRRYGDMPEYKCEDPFGM